MEASTVDTANKKLTPAVARRSRSSTRPSTVDTANKKLTLLGIYKRDLGEAQRTIADIRGTIGMIEKENDRLRAQHDAMASELEREYRRRIVLESERDSYRNLAVMLGVIAAVETIALLVRWGIK